MTTLEAIRDDLLAECSEDHVGVWSVLWEVRERVGTADPLVLRGLTLEVIRSLLDTRAVQAGMFTPDGNRFVAWALPPEQVVREIQRQWIALGRDPNIGDIAYLTATNPAAVSDSRPASPR